MKIFSYDIESTTGSHSDGSMCTFGYCIADENFNIAEQKDIVMKPYTKRFESKIKLHYEKAFIKEQPRFPAFYDEVKELFASSDLIIGFSVGNDVDFLNNACSVYKLDKILYEFVDVQLLFKSVYKRPNLSGLESIANELGIEYEAHRSDEDARVTLLVLKHICLDLNLSVGEVLKKYHITPGQNGALETVPCSNGTYTHKEMNYLIGEFVEANRRHSRRYKGGLSFKTFAFSDEIRYGDIDLFRRIIKKIYELNGRIGQIESSNNFVSLKGELTEKESRSIDIRNTGRKRISTITLAELCEMLGELPKIDFSSDVEIIKEHRREIRRQRELKRQEKRREYLKQKQLQKEQLDKKEEA